MKAASGQLFLFGNMDYSNSRIFDPMKTSIILFSFVISSFCFGQKLPYQFSDSIMRRAFNDTSKNNDYQDKATRLSFIIDYKDALITWDSLGRSGYDHKMATELDKKDSIYFSHFHPVNAHDYIIERAKKERIIMINEAHHIPQHRVFVESLLGDLYKEGYRFLGCETMPYLKDSELNTRKYPVDGTGYYTTQPQFGNMVRTALQDGYYVFGYEADFSKGNVTPKEREIQEAQHIKAYLDAKPRAKMVIYCGYGHLLKADLEVWEKSMAQRVKEFTGIEPFCIDQTTFTEKSAPEFENPFYRNLQLNYDAVFIDSAGNLFGSPDEPNEYDACVYHPRTIYKHGRPDWVFENGRQPIFLRGAVTLPFPCMVFVYHDGEDYSKAVPVDIVELKNEDDANHKALALGKGDYYILIRDTHNQTQVFRTKL